MNESHAPQGPPSQSPEPSAPTPEDKLAARLEALASRRAAAPDLSTPTTKESAGSSHQRSRRHHPAKGAKLAALGISVVSTGVLATFFATSNAQAGTQIQAAQIVTNTGIAAASGSPTLTASNVAVTSSNIVIDGAVFSNKFGNVQVEATFAPDGSLVDVTALQTPSRDGKSVRINDSAVPRLNSEALSAQTANVDTVSGATYTSVGYGQSLQSAIDSAAQNGIAVATA